MNCVARNLAAKCSIETRQRLMEKTLNTGKIIKKILIYFSDKLLNTSDDLGLGKTDENETHH